MIDLIGIPYDGASSFLRGSAGAPAHIRRILGDGASNAYAEDGTRVAEGLDYIDHGDLSVPDEDPEAAMRGILNQLLHREDILGSGILFLGGDHSISFPTISALRARYGKLHVLHFDAHPDLYDSLDGNRYSHACPFARLLEAGALASLTQVGIRTLSPEQLAMARRYDVRQVTMDLIHTDWISELEGPLYISLDLDVLDPAFAPGVSHHEPGGIHTRTLIDWIQRLPVRVVGADIVEYNPARDLNDATARVAAKLLKELMAAMRRS